MNEFFSKSKPITAVESAKALEAAQEPAVPQTQSAGPATNVIDLVQLQSRLGVHTQALLARLIPVFLNTFPDQLAQLVAAHAADDGRRVQFIAHTLKSACANVGALHLAKDCEILEAEAKAGRLTEAGALVAGISAAGEQALLELTMLRQRLSA